MSLAAGAVAESTGTGAGSVATGSDTTGSDETGVGSVATGSVVAGAGSETTGSADVVKPEAVASNSTVDEDVEIEVSESMDDVSVLGEVEVAPLSVEVDTPATSPDGTVAVLVEVRVPPAKSIVRVMYGFDGTLMSTR